MTQEVLLIVYRKLWWLTSAELFRPWTFRIASRTAFRLLKKERRWPDHRRADGELDMLAAPGPPPDPNAVQALLQDLDLTPACRAVLLLHFEQEMPLADVAAVLEIPLGTVKSRLAYGLAAIRRQQTHRRTS